MARIFAVGNNKTFKRSTDNGLTFQDTLGIIPNMPTNNLRAVDAWDENLLLTAGYGLVIFRSTNGGTSFQTIALPALLGSSNIYCSKIKWVNASVVFAMYRSTSPTGNGALYKSTDAGLTWTMLSNGVVETGHAYFDAFDEQKLIRTGTRAWTSNIRTTQQYTINGGVTWSNILGDSINDRFTDKALCYDPLDSTKVVMFTATIGFNKLTASGANFQVGTAPNKEPIFGFTAEFNSLPPTGLRFGFASRGTQVWTFKDSSSSQPLSASIIPATQQINSITCVTDKIILFFGNAGQIVRLSNSVNSPGTVFSAGSENFNDSSFGGNATVPCDVEITSIVTTGQVGNTNGSATVNATVSSCGPLEYRLTGEAWQSSNVFSVPGGTYEFQARCTNDNSCVDSQSATISSTANLSAVATPTNATTNGGTDGTISVGSFTGSGNYVVEFATDGSTFPTTGAAITKLGLNAGTYDIEVTDLTTGQIVNLQATVSEPAPPVPQPPAGDYLFVPALNSLHFVKQETPNDCDVFQTMDNALFCKQDFFGFWHQNYFQKVAKCDPIVVQFLSNYSDHTLELKDYLTNQVVDTYTAEVKEQNTNQEQTELIFITNHTVANQSRVYFSAGGLPVPVTVGNTFEIINNADGFNGSYAIVAIANDILLGQQFLVINKAYTIASPSSNGSAQFTLDAQDFNVYEALLDGLELIPNGEYYLTLKGLAGSGDEWTSEPINLQPKHEGTNLIEYRNFDNAFDMTYTTGITNRIRVESTFFKRVPNSDDVTYRNCDQSLVKLSAKRRRKFLLELWQLPPYMHEKIAVIFGHDVIRVNGVRHQTDEQYQEPKYITRYPLSNAQIVIEQYGWFDKYNSDDIGSVDGVDDGLIIANGGFLKR